MLPIVLVGILAWVVLWPILTAWRAYALVILWGWFVVPTFGLQPLLLWQAVGLSMIASFLTHEPWKTDGEGLDTLLGTTLIGFLWPLLVLIFGALALAIFK